MRSHRKKEFINGFKNLSEAHRGCVATIGSFDGVHLGHQHLLSQVIEKSKVLDLPSLVMVFEPQPNEFFARKQPPARLTRLREKIYALFDAGVDRVLCLHFNEEFRSLSADEFIEKVIVNGIGAKHIVIGDDFRFGADRRGDFKFLEKAGARLPSKQAFTVSDSHTQEFDERRISSTRIRELLLKDRFADAAQLLGRAYSISGRVIHGKKLGRTIGFPTANIQLGRKLAPLSGVYAIEASICGKPDRVCRGVANIGVRPTVDQRRKPILEVFLLDFNEDLYSEFLRVTFIKKIRDEQAFSNIDALTQQIENDVARASVFFGESDCLSTQEK